MSDYTGSNTPIDIRDLWQTPPEVAIATHDEFNFVLDVAASDQNHLYPSYFTEHDNALTQSWSVPGLKGYCWCNPPYSDITPWVKKAADQNKYGSVGTVMLVPADMSVGWFREALLSVSEVRIITGGRLSFVRADTKQPVNGNNKGSIFLIWRPVRSAVPVTNYVERDALMAYGRKLINGKMESAA